MYYTVKIELNLYFQKSYPRSNCNLSVSESRNQIFFLSGSALHVSQKSQKWRHYNFNSERQKLRYLSGVNPFWLLLQYVSTCMNEWMNECWAGEPVCARRLVCLQRTEVWRFGSGTFWNHESNVAFLTLLTVSVPTWHRGLDKKDQNMSVQHVSGLLRF